MSLSIGERLRSARNAKGTGLDEVARATKIQKRILQAIEEDKVDEALDPAYAKIFIKKYAAFLGLDGSALIEEYVAVTGSAANDSTSRETNTPSASVTSPAVFQKVAVPAVVGLVALIGLVFIGRVSLNFFKAVGTSRGPAVTATPPRAVLNRLPVDRKPEEAPKLLVPRSQMLKLSLRTKAEVWLQVKSDGSVIFQNVLPKGAQESWTAKQMLELWTGNASAMELALNGKPLDGVGSGVRKGIKVTHRGLELPE